MKRVLGLVLTAMLLFSMTACTEGKNLSLLSDEEFCNELWLMVDENIVEETPAGLSVRSVEERTFYILSDFNFHFQCGGLAQYLYNTRAVYVDEVTPELKSLGLDEMAELYEGFFAENDVNLDDFLTDEMESGTLFVKYPLDDFDDAFFACYEETDLTEILADYAKNTFLEEYQK